MKAFLDLLGAFLAVPGSLHPVPYRAGGALMVHKITDYVRHEPVRVATMVAALAILVVSIVTGIPVAAIVTQIVVVAGLFEKVRASVAPMVDVVVHAADVPAGSTVQVVPADVEAQGGSL